jgi:hypothetical protein
LTRLPITPYPEHEQDGEATPAQAKGGQDLSLHAVADGVGSPIDVRHREQGIEVEGSVPEAIPDIALRFENHVVVVVV